MIPRISVVLSFIYIFLIKFFFILIPVLLTGSVISDSGVWYSEESLVFKTKMVEKNKTKWPWKGIGEGRHGDPTGEQKHNDW